MSEVPPLSSTTENSGLFRTPQPAKFGKNRILTPTPSPEGWRSLLRRILDNDPL